MKRLDRFTLLLTVLTIVAGTAAHAQCKRSLQIAALSSLDFNDGGSTLVMQKEGTVVKTVTDPNIAKYYVCARRKEMAARELRIEIIEGSEKMPFNMNVAVALHQNDPASASVKPSKVFTLEVAPAREVGTRFLELWVYVYGSMRVGEQPAARYLFDITAQAEFVGE